MYAAENMGMPEIKRNKDGEIIEIIETGEARPVWLYALCL
jgi:hypothetical protein